MVTINRFLLSPLTDYTPINTGLVSLNGALYQKISNTYFYSFIFTVTEIPLIDIFIAKFNLDAGAQIVEYSIAKQITNLPDFYETVYVNGNNIKIEIFPTAPSGADVEFLFSCIIK